MRYISYCSISVENAITILKRMQQASPVESLFNDVETRALAARYHSGQFILVRNVANSTNYRLVDVANQLPVDDTTDAVPFNPTNMLFSSPSLLYALQSCREYVWDGGVAQVFLEVRQSSESTYVLDSTLSEAPLDPHIRADEMERCVNRSSSHVIPVAVLVRTRGI
jgi:hypothetical protein